MQVGLRPRLKVRPSLVDLLVRGQNTDNRNGSSTRPSEGISKRKLQDDVPVEQGATASSPPPSPLPSSADAAPATELHEELQPQPGIEQAANLPLPTSPASTASPQAPSFLLADSLPLLSGVTDPLAGPIIAPLSSPLLAPTSPVEPTPAPAPIASRKMAPVSLHLRAACSSCHLRSRTGY